MAATLSEIITKLLVSLFEFVFRVIGVYMLWNFCIVPYVLFDIFGDGGAVCNVAGGAMPFLTMFQVYLIIVFVNMIVK